MRPETAPKHSLRPPSWSTGIADVVARGEVIASYVGHASPALLTFLAARVAMVPLARVSDKLPSQGRLLEVGCGHGVVSQYLARRSSGRQVVAFDPDHRRLHVATAAARRLPNLQLYPSADAALQGAQVSGVVIIGVLYLLDDAQVVSILKMARRALRDDGVLLLSDIPADTGGDWIHRLHILRERLSLASGFVTGPGPSLHFRSTERWRELLLDGGFQTIARFSAPVALHRTFDWICS